MYRRNILLAGSTGYLGGYLAKELCKEQIPLRLLIREGKKTPVDNPGLGVVTTDVTRQASLIGVMNGIDTVISTVGITRQKDGLTYMEVDYQANRNLLNEALNAGVSKFVYVASLHGDEMRHLKICEAKEKFVDELKESGLDYIIVRPNGFYSDIGEFLEMAHKGRIFLLGNGRKQLNPIHGADLAKFVVNRLYLSHYELEIGGPDVYTHREIGQLCFQAAGKPVKFTYIPHWVRLSVLTLLRTFTHPQTYGPLEFFLTTLARDMIAPTYGEIALKDYLIAEYDRLNDSR